MDREAATGRTSSHPVATCCLVLLVIPVCVVAYFWYDIWHAARTARALGASSDTGTATLTGVVWRHTEAPASTTRSPSSSSTAPTG
ncbi:hypothetical protein AB0D34_17960 [Streptomyces sp. NPDC048420]|uniref:hypothetical protein n=1 Tax=Streptomyces sp. NPDC048420 TaxID=3155755 RepID=UPI003427ED1C